MQPFVHLGCYREPDSVPGARTVLVDSDLLSVDVQASGLIVCATIGEPVALSDEQFERLLRHVRSTGKMVVGRDEILRAVEPDQGVDRDH